ncbi:hypothetical protein V8F20_002331 [Naviculisporaceae sp. PSN 640]
MSYSRTLKCLKELDTQRGKVSRLPNSTSPAEVPGPPCGRLVFRTPNYCATPSGATGSTPPTDIAQRRYAAIPTPYSAKIPAFNDPQHSEYTLAERREAWNDFDGLVKENRCPVICSRSMDELIAGDLGSLSIAPLNFSKQPQWYLPVPYVYIGVLVLLRRRRTHTDAGDILRLGEEREQLKMPQSGLQQAVGLDLGISSLRASIWLATAELAAASSHKNADHSVVVNDPGVLYLEQAFISSFNETFQMLR